MDYNNRDGSIRWIKKTKNRFVNPPIIESEIKAFTFSELYSCNIRDGIQGESIIIQTKSLISTIELDKITLLEISYNSIIINSSSEVSFFLYFVSEVEAISAYNKIEGAVDNIPIECDDSPIVENYQLKVYDEEYPFDFISYPAILFVDNLEPFEVLNEDDAVEKLNDLFLDNIIFSANDVPWSITVTYMPHKTEYLPKSIKILSKYFEMLVAGKQLTFNMDMGNKEYFVFGDSVLLKKTDDYYALPFSSFSTFRIYYSKPICEYFELKGVRRITFNNPIPVFEGDDMLTSNYPIIKSFKSDGIVLINLHLCLINSNETLHTLELIDNGHITTGFHTFVNLKKMILKRHVNTSISLPGSLETLYLENINASSISGNYSNLISLRLKDCGRLSTLSLPVSPLRQLFIENCAITALTLSTTLETIYNLTISKTLLTEIALTSNIIKNANQIDISYNDEMTLEKYNEFLQVIVDDNISSAGFLDMRRNVVDEELGVDERDELLSMLRRNSWYIVF